MPSIVNHEVLYNYCFAAVAFNTKAHEEALCGRGPNLDLHQVLEDNRVEIGHEYEVSSDCVSKLCRREKINVEKVFALQILVSHATRKVHCVTKWCCRGVCK